MVTVIMEQRGPEVKFEQSEILPTRFGHWFHKLPELMELFTVKLVVVQKTFWPKTPMDTCFPLKN